MKETPSSRRVLHLIPEGTTSPSVEAITRAFMDDPVKDFTVLSLTEANAREALEKIFAADHVSVWGNI